MTTQKRRPARNQALPQHEVDLLNALALQEDLNPLFTRTALLYESGWTLRAIGDSLTPKKQRSTIRTWVQKAPAPPASTDTSTVPVPILSTPSTPVPAKPKSPGIDPTDRTRIQDLAPIARLYRATMSPNHAAAQANRELSELCNKLYAEHVTVQELADAASVTYRAMARRLGKVIPK